MELAIWSRPKAVGACPRTPESSFGGIGLHSGPRRSPYWRYDDVLVGRGHHVGVKRKLCELQVVEAGFHAGTLRGSLGGRNILTSTYATTEIFVFLIGVV